MTTSTYTQSGRPALPPRSRDSEKGGWSDPRSSRYTESDDADDSGYGSDNPRPSKSRRTEAAPSVGYVTLPPAYGDDESSSRRPTTESSTVTPEKAAQERRLPPRTPPPISLYSTTPTVSRSGATTSSFTGRTARSGRKKSILKRRMPHLKDTAKSRREYHSAWGEATNDMAHGYDQETQSRLNGRTSTIITFSSELPWRWHGKWIKGEKGEGGTYERDDTEKRTGFGISSIQTPLDKLKSKKNCQKYADMFFDAGIDTLPVSRKTLQSDFPMSYLVSTGAKSQKTFTASEMRSWQAEKDTMLREKLVDADALSEDVPVYDLAGKLIPGASTAYPSLCTANIDMLLADSYMGGDLGQQAAQFVSNGLTMIAKDTETRNRLVDNGRHWRTVNGKDGKGQRIPRMEDRANHVLGVPISKFDDRDYSKYNPDHCGTLTEDETDFASKRSKLRDAYLSDLERSGYIDRTNSATDISNLSFTTEQWDTEFPGLGKRYSDYSEYAAETRSKATDNMLEYLRRRKRDPRKLSPEDQADLKKKGLQHFAAHFQCVQATTDQAKEVFPTIGSTSYSALQQSPDLSEDERSAVAVRFVLEQMRWQGQGALLVDSISQIKECDLPTESDVESAWSQANTQFARELDEKRTRGKARVKHQKDILQAVNERFRASTARRAAKQSKS